MHTARQAAGAVARIGTIDRAGCRARVERPTTRAYRPMVIRLRR
jgi:hypothetical protein